ncbi:hypothetical protein SprV_0200783700 [Sparganum proliferum]
MPADILGINKSHWTSSYQLQHRNNTNPCSPVQPNSPLTSTVNTDRTHEPPLSFFSIASTSAATASAPTAIALSPSKPTNIYLPNVNTSDVDSIPTRPHSDRTFTSHIGLVGHFRIHCTETS